jgi:hypothetical protein
MVEKSPTTLGVGSVKKLNHVVKIEEELVDTIVQVYRLYGFKSQDYQIGKTVKHWEELSKELGPGGWMKVAKYKLAAFFSYHLGLTLPVKPFSAKDNAGILLGGKAYRWCRNLLDNISDERKQSFLMTIKQSKKGMPRPDAKLLAIAQRKTEETLTQPQRDYHQEEWSALVRNHNDYMARFKSWADVTDDDETKEEQEKRKEEEEGENLYGKPNPKILWENSAANCIYQIQRTTREVFSEERTRVKKENLFTYSDRIVNFFPSTSANYNRSRRNAGAVGEILCNQSIMVDLRKPGGYLKVKSDLEKVQRDLDKEEQGKPGEYLFIEPIKQENELHYELACKTLWFRLKDEAKKETFETEAVALSEALKVRVITKMAPLTQTLMKPVWKRIHTALRHHKTFRLVGTPQNEREVLDCLGAQLKEDEIFLSGDYEAATDNMTSWATKAAWQVICDELKLDEIEALQGENLLIHNIIQGKTQTQGQLMGSILSFPLLCIINAAMTRWALERSMNKIILLRDSPIGVNGDDVMARGRKTKFLQRDFYTQWQSVTKIVGLKESIGKTYVSKDFVDINSTTYTYTPLQPHDIKYQQERKGEIKEVTRKCPFNEVRYVNLGLMKGYKRSTAGGGGEQLDSSDIGTKCRTLIERCPPELQEEVMSEFIQCNKKQLTRYALPWYIPEWLGGLGLPTGTWGQPSDLDMRVATRILMNWKKERPVPSNTTATTWKSRELALRRLPEPFYMVSKEPNNYTELFDRVVGKKTVDLLFDSGVSLELLFQPDNPARDIFRHNEKLWLPARGLGPKLDSNRLVFRTLRACYTETPTLAPKPERTQVRSASTDPHHNQTLD